MFEYFHPKITWKLFLKPNRTVFFFLHSNNSTPKLHYAYRQLFFFIRIISPQNSESFCSYCEHFNSPSVSRIFLGKFLTSPPNSTPRRFPLYLLLTFILYFFLIFYPARCTLPDFSSISSLASLSFLYCCHRKTT